MAVPTVTVPAAMSYDGTQHIYSGDADPNTGMLGGMHTVNLIPSFMDMVSVASYTVTVANGALTNADIATTKASEASASATQAANYAAAINATSTVSYAIGIGSKTFGVGTGKQFQAGQFVTISDASNSANYMFGQVTSYSSSTLTVNVESTEGSGTIANWNISISGIKGDTGASGSTIELGTTGTAVNVGNAASPTVGQALIATSPTEATWQDIDATPDFLLINAGVI